MTMPADFPMKYTISAIQDWIISWFGATISRVHQEPSALAAGRNTDRLWRKEVHAPDIQEVICCDIQLMTIL
jgi:hypothetical protein